MHTRPISRRSFSREALGSLLTFALVDTLVSRQALSAAVRPTVERWLAGVNELAVSVKDHSLKQLAWQQKIEELFAQVPLDDFLQLIDFERLAATTTPPDNGARSLRPKFPEIAGIPTRLAFGSQVFQIKQGHSVVPHGHSNMATAFLILRGKLHGRHYDRVADEPAHFLIRPTIDRQFSTGECSTVSDFKDNIHWFRAESDVAYIFNIHVLGVASESSLPTGRLYLDPQGESVAGGLIRARRIDHDEAHRLYG